MAVEPGSKQSFWRKMIGGKPNRAPIKDPRLVAVRKKIEETILDLKSLLHSADQIDRKSEYEAAKTKKSSASGVGNVKLPAADVNISLGNSLDAEHRKKVEDHYKYEKIASLHRNILLYRSILSEISAIGQSFGYILLDDLYHIRSEDQVNVVDYFHRIAKGTGIWLKIGTIRHRTTYYIAGDPPKGMKIGDDCEEIDLDVTLEKYQLTKAFLMKILEQFSRECNVKLSSIITDGAKDRLVIGSGGVARDLLSIFRRSIEVAKERLASGDFARGDKVGAEDVNKAAGENDSYKQTEFNRDTNTNEQGDLRSFFLEISNFCVEKNKTNCFLVRKDLKTKETSMIAELVDLKLLHHCNSRVTVRSKVGRIYEAYMLDIAQYTGERARRNLDIIEFWSPSGAEKLRRSSIIFAE